MRFLVSVIFLSVSLFSCLGLPHLSLSRRDERSCRSSGSAWMCPQVFVLFCPVLPLAFLLLFSPALFFSVCFFSLIFTHKHTLSHFTHTFTHTHTHTHSLSHSLTLSSTHILCGFVSLSVFSSFSLALVFVTLMSLPPPPVHFSGSHSNEERNRAIEDHGAGFCPGGTEGAKSVLGVDVPEASPFPQMTAGC